MAVEVLSQTASSSAAERNWSLFEFMKPSTMEKLVYIHANARLLNKITAVDYEETNVECKTEANEASGSDSCETDLGSENEID